MPAHLPPARSAFGVRDFRLLIQSRLLFSFAVQIQAVVMGWQVYEITRDPLYLGLIGLTEAVPALSLAPIAGHLVDRSNPLRIYRGVALLSLASASILFLFSAGWIRFGSSGASVALIYLAAFITGTARAFAGPSLYSLIPQLLPRELLTSSAPFISGAIQFASVAGPALGGLLYAWKGSTLPYGVDCFLLVSALISLSLIDHEVKRPKAPLAEPLFSSLTSGLRFVFGHQLLLSAMALDMFAVLFGGAVAILPVFAGEILNVGPTGLGFLRAAPSIGAFAMTLLLIRVPIRRNAGRKLLWVVGGFGVCMIGFALSRSLWLSVLFLAASGALDSVSMVIRSSIVQLCSPDRMRGRIAAVNSIFIGSSNEIGAFESGVAAKLIGAVPAVIFGGCITVMTVIVTAWLAPRLRTMHLDELESRNSES